MSNSLLRTDEEIAEIYERHKRTVYRVCFAYMKNTADTEDAVQDTFFRLIKAGPAFENTEHEKAWLIRTATNVCKNAVRHWWRKRENIEDLRDVLPAEETEPDRTIQTVLELPNRYKTAVYLYYYEGYTGAEIAKLLKKPQSTIRNYLHEARIMLRERLGEDFDEES